MLFNINSGLITVPRSLPSISPPPPPPSSSSTPYLFSPFTPKFDKYVVPTFKDKYVSEIVRPEQYKYLSSKKAIKSQIRHTV